MVISFILFLIALSHFNIFLSFYFGQKESVMKDSHYVNVLYHCIGFYCVFSTHTYVCFV